MISKLLTTTERKDRLKKKAMQWFFFNQETTEKFGKVNSPKKQ